MQLIIPYKTPSGAGSGDMLKANNLGDVVSVSAARTNLDLWSKAEATSRDVVSPPGGLVFIGPGFGSAARAYGALTGENIGTKQLSVWCRVRIIQPASGVYPNLWMFSSAASGAYGSYALFAFCYLSGGSTKLQTVIKNAAGATARTYTFDVQAHVGRVIDLVWTRNATVLSVYVNGVLAGSEDNAAWAGDVVPSGTTYLRVGGTSSAGEVWQGGYYRCAPFDWAMTADEVLELMLFGILYKHRWGNWSKYYASDFSAGVDNWSAISPAVLSAPESIGGETDCLKLTAGSGSPTYAAGKRALVYGLGQRLRVSCKAYRPAANTTGVAIDLRNGSLTSLGASQVSLAADTWTDVAWDVAAANAASAYVALALTTSGGSAEVTEADCLYVKQVKVEVLGAVCDWDFGVGKGTFLPDRSANGFYGEITTSGVVHKFERRAGELVLTRYFAHSDISATGGTTRLLDLPANCGLLEVEFDRESAFDAATTLSVGTSGTAGKHVYGQPVDATGKALADSLSKVSESAAAYTTVYLKKNQATTQGATTVRARLIIRG
jgi:hypothetical protein